MCSAFQRRLSEKVIKFGGDGVNVSNYRKFFFLELKIAQRIPEQNIFRET